MQQTDSTNTEPLWQFIRLNDLNYPPRPVTEAVRRGISTLLSTFTFRRGKQPISESPSVSLSALDEHLLARIAPYPNLDEPHNALSHLINEARSDLLAIVHTPHSYTDTILQQWAEAHGALILVPPTPDQILSGGWKPSRIRDDEASDTIVVPRLEKFYLRHPEGLDTIRRFLDYLARQNRRTIIAGDVSAWHYLRHVVQLDAFTGVPFILDPFSAKQLAQWYLNLCRSGGEASTVFLEAISGNTILSAEGEDGRDAGSTKPDTSPFLNYAAWYTEGQPCIARTLWRNNLLRADSGEDSSELIIGGGEKVWVKSWKDLALPELPDSISDKHTYLLALLLIHDGLDTRVAAELAGLTFAETRGMLDSLRTMSLLDHNDGILAYLRPRIPSGAPPPD